MNQEQPFFSIIIPTYGRPCQLPACLQSFTSLDYSRDCFEVIVVDDGSETPPEAATARFRDQLDVTLLQQSHAGPATARNAGAMKARGTFLAFTDDDCLPGPDWLKRLAVRFAKDPDCVIGGRTTNALPDNPYSSASQLLIDYLYSYYNADPNRAGFLTSNNIAIAADRFRAIGGFDTTFPSAAAEDREFCDRWLSYGYRMIYASDVIVYHAHPLTFRTFLRQHFCYGRGAFSFHCIRARRTFQYHRMRARRRTGRIELEPLRFYLNLLRYPLEGSRNRRKFWLAVLLAVSQVANIAGFLLERYKKTSTDGHSVQTHPRRPDDATIT